MKPSIVVYTLCKFENMATVRDSDTSLWLHNKLGDNDDLWSGITSISTQLHQDVLRNTHDCFQTLNPTVKLKLLMAILHMPLRKVEEVSIVVPCIHKIVMFRCVELHKIKIDVLL